MTTKWAERPSEAKPRQIRTGVVPATLQSRAVSEGYNLGLVSRSVNAGTEAGLTARLGAFVTERFPFALELVLDAFDRAGGDPARFRDALTRGVERVATPPLAETTPGVPAATRRAQALEELADACEGFLQRDAIRRSLTADERREVLRGMLLTRATDNRLKVFFGSGGVRQS